MMYPLAPRGGTKEEEEDAIKDLKDKGMRAGVSRLLIRWEILGLREEAMDWDVFSVSHNNQ